MMKIAKTVVLILAISFSLAFSAHAQPTIYTVVLDASGSVSKPDFRLECDAAAAFITVIHAASQLEHNLGKLADFMSVAFFGGKDDYAPFPYFNASHGTKVKVMSRALEQVRHPEFGYTAIYSALLKATITTAQQEESLGGTYNHIILLVTDGRDTQSPNEVKQLIRRLYPNNEVFLAIIGVGSEAKVDELRQIANDVRHIDNFAELAAVLAIYSAGSSR